MGKIKNIKDLYTDNEIELLKHFFNDHYDYYYGTLTMVTRPENWNRLEQQLYSFIYKGESLKSIVERYIDVEDESYIRLSIKKRCDEMLQYSNMYRFRLCSEPVFRYDAPLDYVGNVDKHKLIDLINGVAWKVRSDWYHRISNADIYNLFGLKYRYCEKKKELSQAISSVSIAGVPVFNNVKFDAHGLTFMITESFSDVFQRPLIPLFDVPVVIEIDNADFLESAYTEKIFQEVMQGYD